MPRWKALPNIYKSQMLERNRTLHCKHRKRYQRCLLLDKIANKHKHLKQLNKQLDYEKYTLNNKKTWMKRFAITNSINIAMNTYKNMIEITQEKKFNNLYTNKHKEKGMKKTSMAPFGICQQEFYPIKNIKYFVTA